MRQVRYTDDALRSLKRQGNMAARIRKATAEHARDRTVHANNVTPLVGTDGKRLRVGGFRVLFQETETDILVVAIGPRGNVYD